MDTTDTTDTTIRELFEIDGRGYEVVKFLPPNKILCWSKTEKVTADNWKGGSGGIEEVMCILKLEDIDFDIVKSMKVFNVLSDDVKENLKNHIHIVKDDVSDRMAKAREARKDRKSKYENIPDTLACSTCGHTVEAIPSKIAAYCNGKEMLLEDYLRSYKCKRCKDLYRPAKVEKIKLTCKCGFTVVYPANIVQKYADKKGLTREEFIGSYSCKRCSSSTFGRDKLTTTTTTTTTMGIVTTTTTTRGRKPKEEFVGMPRKMVCSCGKEVNSNLHYLKVKAEKEGVTIMSLIEGFKCQVCRKE